MKAICIENTQKIHSATSFRGEKKFRKLDLTIGKVYEITMLPVLAPGVLPKKKCEVINDSGRNIYADLEIFKTIEEYRNLKIQEILK